MPIEAKIPAVGAAGDIYGLSNLPIASTENLGDWQRLGDVAANVVAVLPARRERWVARHCRVAPSVARAVASVVFPEVTQ